MSKRKTNEWRKIGTVSKRQLAGKNVIEKLHNILQELAPRAKSISEFGVTQGTDKYLMSRLTKEHGAAAAPWLSLQYLPAIIDSGEDFVIYKRSIK